MQFFGAASILSPPFNQNTLPLIVPGPQVLSTSVPGGNGANGNLITDGTTSTLSVTFDRPMQASTFTPQPGAPDHGPDRLPVRSTSHRDSTGTSPRTTPGSTRR